MVPHSTGNAPVQVSRTAGFGSLSIQARFRPCQRISSCNNHLYHMIVGSGGEDFNNLGVSPPSKLLGFACKQGVARPRTEVQVPCLTDARRMPYAASVSENCVPSNVQIDLREEVLGRQFGEWSFASLLQSRWLRTRLTHRVILHHRLHPPAPKNFL